MLKAVEGLFEGLTSLNSEDLIPDEEVLFSTYGVWFSELTMMSITILAIVISLGLFVYGFLSGVSGVFGFLLDGFALICFFSGVVFSVSLLVNHYSTRYFITNYRVIKRTGLLSKKLIYVQYDKIQNVKVSKNIEERMIDMGDIYVDTSGGPDIEMILLNVPDPERIQRMILEGMEKQKIQSA